MTGMDKARKDVGTYVSRCLVWKHSLSLCIHEDQGGLVQGLLLAVCPEQFVKYGSFLHLEWYSAPILQNAHVLPSSQHVQGREPFLLLCYRVMTSRQDHLSFQHSKKYQEHDKALASYHAFAVGWYMQLQDLPDAQQSGSNVMALA